MAVELSSAEYEQRTRRLVECISERSLVSTTRLTRDIRLQGRATRHQVDVLWEFTAGGARHRVLLECRRYRTSLKQKDVLAFKGVIDDLHDPEVVTTGVMVTATGYQSGAQAVADTYGIVIVELREPTDADLVGRALRIRVTISARSPFVRDIEVQPADPLDAARIKAWNDELELEVDGQRHPLNDVMLRGELAALRELATPAHRVVRHFAPAASLLIEGRPAFDVVAVAATVGEQEMDPFDVTVGGRDRFAWMVKDTLQGTHAWFTQDGQVHLTD